jgi:glycosyltransferase involved in cell wall biosynthesis
MKPFTYIVEVVGSCNLKFADGSVALCCDTYDNKYNIAGNFLDISHEDLQKLKNLHILCGECMKHGLHLSAVYEPFDVIDTAARKNVASFNISTNNHTDDKIGVVDNKEDCLKETHTPLISIGLPTYNGETFLRQALDSLLAQDYQNFEIIISDNASTDGTAAICREYAATDARIKFFQNDENRGAVYNFCRVLALSSGKYFMWAADHDLWHSTLLTKASAVLESDPSVVLCYPRAERIDGEGRSLGLAANTMDTRGLSAVARYAYLLNNISGGDMICGLIRPEALRRLDPKTVWGADQATLAGLALQGTFAHLPEPLFSWRKIRDESMEHRKKTVPLTLDPKDSQGMLAMSMMELWRQLGEECLALVKASDLPEAEKERLVTETKTIFTRRYGVHWPASATAVEAKESPEKTCAAVLPATAAAPSPSNPDLPLVSVIVSTCNRPDRLAPVLQSLLNQTYKHYEIIVVNDCGVAMNNIVGWLNQQGNITYVRHERQRGVTAARNTGLKLSRGKYIAYLDEDDSFGPNHLENLVTFLEGGGSTSPPEG